MQQSHSTPAPDADRSGAKLYIVGLEYGGQVYLFDEVEYRRGFEGEVIVDGDGHHFALRRFARGREFFCHPVDAAVADAQHAGRYWPGDDVMAQREIDATVDAFVAGGR